MLDNKLTCMSLTIFACLGICFSLNTFASQFINTNTTSVFLIIFFFIYILHQQYALVFRFLFVFFIAVTNLTGVIIIEYSNFYLKELDTVSSNNNSLAILAFGWFLFLATIYLLEFFYPYKNNENSSCPAKIKFNNIIINSQTLFSILFFIFLIPICMKVLPHPYFLEKVDRFLYFDHFFSDTDKRILNVLNYFLPLIIVILIKFKSKLNFFLLCLYILMRFFTGEKFGLFFYIFCYFAIFGSCHISLSKENILKYTLKFLVIFIVLISIVFGHRVLLYNSNSENNITYLVQRIAQNGQLWWALYPEACVNDFNFSELNDEVEVFYTHTQEIRYSTGIYKVMEKTTPMKLVSAKIAAKSRYANSTFATIFYYFGIPGMFLFSIFAAVLYWILTRYMIYIYDNIFLLDLIICGKLFTIANTMLTQSDFNLLFSYQTILCVIGLIILNLFRSFSIKHNHQRVA